MEGKGNKTKNRMMEGSQVMESGEREEEWSERQLFSFII